MNSGGGAPSFHLAGGGRISGIVMPTRERDGFILLECVPCEGMVLSGSAKGTGRFWLFDTFDFGCLVAPFSPALLTALVSFPSSTDAVRLIFVVLQRLLEEYLVTLISKQ